MTGLDNEQYEASKRVKEVIKKSLESEIQKAIDGELVDEDGTAIGYTYSDKETEFGIQSALRELLNDYNLLIDKEYYSD